MKKPVIDLGDCVKCDICVELCPRVFRMNDAGYVEILDLDAYPEEEIDTIIRTCRGDCLGWDEDD
ncbi:MAG: ferredoxin [Pseudomonadota bacterium]